MIRRPPGSPLTLFSRTDRTVGDYGIPAGHLAGPLLPDTDSTALAGRAALIYGTEGRARCVVHGGMTEESAKAPHQTATGL